MKEFDINMLKNNIKKVNEIDFAFLFGSARSGVVKTGSDVDIAVHLNRKLDLGLLSKIAGIVEDSTGGECDLTILNDSSAILGMEALKGKLLFCKEEQQEEYLDFYSYTCRKYEDDICWMNQQLKYRGY